MYLYSVLISALFYDLVCCFTTASSLKKCSNMDLALDESILKQDFNILQGTLEYFLNHESVILS